MGVFETNLQFYSDLESKWEQVFQNGCFKIKTFKKEIAVQLAW